MKRVYDSVRYIHEKTGGIGYGGLRVGIVGGTCEECGYDRLLEFQRLTPGEETVTKRYCNNPGCSEYHRGKAVIPEQ
ncbi:hypothetical protein HSR121_2045 [Halapricum desulfuricans]|uniref:Uncharacterized protein n=1 Tax=Halapricum desulfuricans TaxID=2841257 RepID=A0A897N0Z8_9EURY|nr:hypothetical protein HSR121_2045 [Halapricum desulfuricans]